jgi:hypothetical protein
MDGLAKNTADLTADFGESLAVLPEWARPATDVYAIHQGSGRAIFWLRVYANGVVAVGRYRNETGLVAAASGSQFPLTLSWIAADAYAEKPDGEVIVTYADGMVMLSDTGSVMRVTHDGAGNVTVEKYSGVTVVASGGNVIIEEEE